MTSRNRSRKESPGARFRPLFWGFVFNLAPRGLENRHPECRFRPLFWGFVFNFRREVAILRATGNVFVPSSGDLFLICRFPQDISPQRLFRVFVPSSGDLFLMRSPTTGTTTSRTCFRPLFWGFVFNGRAVAAAWQSAADVFVPSSGDLFLMLEETF